MKSYAEFISQPDAKERIGKIADKFEGYLQSNYESLLPADIELLINNWLQNFNQFDSIDYDLLLRILDNLTIAKDDEIRGLLVETINNKILPDTNADISDIYICPLGEEYESSYRLSAFFNNHEEAPFYKSNIKTLLQNLRDKPNAVIVFFDDFLFSGGQLVCIFKKLLGIKLDLDDTDDIYSERVAIDNPNLINVLKEHKIILYFHLAFLSGYENKKFSRFVSDNNLDVKIYNGHIENDDIGCFGTVRDIKLIEGKSKTPFHSGVFANIQPARVRPLYELLKEVGVQLLKNEHAEGKKWNEHAFKKHALGYGGKAKLILGGQNVPTATLTALWLPSPGNRYKTIKIGDKEVNWKSLFYRKPKRGANETYLAQNKNIYPKISVRQVHLNAHFTDTYHYDLLTLLSLDRRSFVCIYGHEPKDRTVLSTHLNELEEEIFEKDTATIIKRRRLWYTYHIIAGNEEDVSSNVNRLVATNISRAIGLELILTDVPDSISFVQRVLANIWNNNPSVTISVILDCPTRNGQVLKRLRNIIEIDKFTTVFISNRLIFEAVKIERKNSFFESSEGGSHIFYCLNLLSGRDEEEFRQIQKSLQSFNKIKSQLGSHSIQVNSFSPKGFIDDFCHKVEIGGSFAEGWQEFYHELISVIDEYSPELIEGIFYYAASCTNDLIRFSTLKYATNAIKRHLIDYWVEGSGCKKQFFENVAFAGFPLVPNLFYPILRYYNRHRSTIGLDEQIRRLLVDILDAEEYTDYWIAEKILGTNANKYAAEILGNYSVSLMKLSEAGVDVFEEMDTSMWKNDSIPGETMNKIMLSASMSGKKIQLIFENYQHLITF